MLRFLTAGESHGKALVTIIEGVPAGLAIDFDADHRAAAPPPGRVRARAPDGHRVRSRRGPERHPPRRHHRRADRAAHPEQGLGELAEDDVRRAGAAGRRDGADRPAVTRPRPGHADLAGVVKYGHDDIRNVLERASARETAARVAVGAIARQLLRAASAPTSSATSPRSGPRRPTPLAVTFEQVRALKDDGLLHCVDADLEQRMIAEIDRPATPATRWAAASR